MLPDEAVATASEVTLIGTGKSGWEIVSNTSHAVSHSCAEISVIAIEDNVTEESQS
jgi:hypothetical protein